MGEGEDDMERVADLSGRDSIGPYLWAAGEDLGPAPTPL